MLPAPLPLCLLTKQGCLLSSLARLWPFVKFFAPDNKNEKNSMAPQFFKPLGEEKNQDEE